MKRLWFTLVTMFVMVLTAGAQEGMWLLNQIDQLNLKENGLEINTVDIYNPGKPALANAIVQLGGGTASFVSPDGLLLTNHHVAYGALQRVSEVESNYLKDGFLARDRAKEIQAPGYEARILIEMEDVTHKILKEVKGVEDLNERDKIINETISKWTTKLEKDKSDLDARIVSMFNGRQYILFKYKVLKDIRIVYSPPLAIGNYGGEIDNWMWPRHTGDFSFLRAYVNKDGEGVPFSEDNVPYHPEIYLKISQGNLEPGDLTFIIGFPGSTTRYRTSNSADWNLHDNYPFSIKNYQEIIDIAEELTADDPEGQLKVANLCKGLANVKKNYQGKVDAMNKTKFVEKKKAFEKEFLAWANSNPDTKEKYGDLLNQIQDLYKLLAKTKDRDNILGLFQGLAGTVPDGAYYAVLVASERDKPEEQRIPGFDPERFKTNIINGMEYAWKDYYEPFDKAMLIRTLEQVKELPKGQEMSNLNYIFEGPYGSVEGFVEQAYSNTKIKDPEYFAGLLDMSVEELKATEDPFIIMMLNIYPYMESYREINNTFSTQVVDLRKQYIDGLYGCKGGKLYPDANSTIRFTYGPLKGYRP